MKIAITKSTKEVITIAKMAAVRKVIEAMKDDTGLKDYAEMAVNLASDANGSEIYKVEAEIALNYRVWDRYDEGTEDVDVWLEIKAFNAFRETFYEIGVCVSDLWELSDNNREATKQKMYIRKYELAK